MRYIIFAMICVACMINYIVKGNMSIIILYGSRYAWSAYDQSLVIGSYFWGIIATTFIGGVCAERYGARKVAGIGVVIAALLSGLAPIAANHLWQSIVVRFFTGMAMATLPPSMQALIADWAPPEEKGKFLSANLANGVGTIIDWSISGVIIKHFGWPYAFYVVVLILGVFAVAWFIVVYDSPIDHPRITMEEKNFIIISKQKPWPPIASMMKSVPFWALVIFHFGTLFTQYIFLTAAPKYLSEVHHFNIEATGLLSSIPYLTRLLFAVGFGVVGDFIYKRNLMSPNTTRKSFAFFSHIVPACFLISLLFVGNQPYVCITFISLALGFSGAISITSLQNPHDLSPNFAATIFGFMHTVASTSGFIAPIIVAHFTRIKSSDQEWQHVFMIGAATLIICYIVFILFGTANVQSWNTIEDEKVETRLLKTTVDRK